MKRRRIGISYKITSGYVILIVCIAISTILLNTQITKLQEERNGIIQYDSGMRTLSNTLERQIIKMESNLNRFLITDNQTYLQNYYEELATWESNYAELTNLVQDYSGNEKLLEPIYSGILNWIDTVGEPLNDAILNNNDEQVAILIDGTQSSNAIMSLQEGFSTFRNSETAAIQDKITELNNKNTNLTFILFFSLFVLAIITIVIFTIISRKISSSIKDVTSAIEDINTNEGHAYTQLVVRTNDEVQDLVQAANELLQTMNARNWFQKNLADIVTAYQGVDTLYELGDNLLNSLTTSTNSVYGAFYIQDPQNKSKFKKVSAFAEGSSNVGREEIISTHGFVGQSIKEKRILTYGTADDHLHYLETAFGNIPISHGMIVPVIFGQEVIAVLELAALKPYSGQQLALIEEIIIHLGVTINSIQGRMEVIRLLNESQAMSEELQVQSEELQTQSEELQMQTEELTTINERLEERTRDAEQKTRDLQKTQTDLKQIALELQQSSNYKSEFLANMSHELRTPLNSILILSEMLAENKAQSLSDDDLEFAKVIHKSGNDLLLLINDILDLSKVEAGKLDLWYSETDLYEVPTHIQNLFAPIANQKGLTLSANVDSALETVFHTDAKRFYQIINNLLSNALKFTESGSVTVNVTIPELTPSMEKLSQTWIKLSVTDTGIGIPQDKQSIVFESFQQADGATVRKYGGTGLGLSICREVSKLLGGWLTLQSEVGVGSTFTLYLPSLSEGNPMNVSMIEEMVAEKEMVQIEVPASAIHHFQNKRIIIADDDYRNIYALRHALEQKGAHVIEATNGVECLNILQSGEHVDAVLMDIMMPEMDGYETITHIREVLQLHDLPIIALTAKAMKQDRERAFEVGASDYISKPLNLEQLFSLLTVWLTSEANSING